MKIGEMFGGGCKYMPAITLLCKSNGLAMPENVGKNVEYLLRNGAKFIVSIHKTDGIDVVEMRERSELFAKIVAGRMRRGGTILYFHDGAMCEVTRENFAKIQRGIMPKRVIEKSDIPRNVKTRTSAFDECVTDRPGNRRCKTWGYKRTESAHESQERFIWGCGVYK